MWAGAISAIAVELLCRATLSFYLGNWTFVGFACLRFAPAVAGFALEPLETDRARDSSAFASGDTMPESASQKPFRASLAGRSSAIVNSWK